MHAVAELPEEEGPQEHHNRNNRVEILCVAEVAELAECVERVVRCKRDGHEEERIHDVAECLMVVFKTLLSRRWGLHGCGILFRHCDDHP